MPTSAAVVLTLRLPLSVLVEDQAKRSPDSKPSAKIKSGNGVVVAVGVKVAVGVSVGTSVFVAVSVADAVGVSVGMGVLVAVAV